MSTINERMIRSLEAADATRPLVRLVDQILADYPDPYLLASQHAQQILQRHTGKRMDPRFVWWHQFNTASSSASSFNGWKHSGPPQKSMTMTELVIERFDLHFQDASDELDQLGGFYLQGPHAETYGVHNEVAMLGRDVQADLWALDFAALYRSEVERFWSANSKHFAVLAKVNLLGQGAIASRHGRITGGDYERLRAWVAEDLAQGEIPTLSMLERDSTSSALRVQRYVFGEGDRGCLFTLSAQDGRTLIYVPWSPEALHGFDSELAMASWLRRQLQAAGTFEAYVQGAHSNPRDRSQNQLIRVHLQGIADSRTDEAGLIALSLFKRQLDTSLFPWLAGQAALEMRRNAQLLTDNARLRKAMCSGYLSAFLGVFGGLAPLGWPMSLILLGASVSKVGVDVDEALHAADELGRKRALRSAMIESVFATLNLIDIGFQSTYASLAYQAPPHEQGVRLDDWQGVASPTLPVEGQETNALLTAETAQSGRLQGIRVGGNGSFWIDLNGLSYRVRYSHELAVWLVVPQDNPFALAPLRPVRLNDAGEWEMLEPPRLLGGSPPAVKGMNSTSSPFWDTYTSIDSARSRPLSVRAMQRQKTLLESWPVVELARGQLPDKDLRGLECVMVNGSPAYSYHCANEYFNELIEYYTSEESKVNDVFRSGTYKYDDEDAYITDLADSLAQLPRNNDVTLYRGGHRSRGTSGESYRNGHLQVGNVLINTDFTSFTENPYKVAEFATLPFSGAPGGAPGLFDDSSVVFELPAGSYRNATPISAFAIYWEEAESLFPPGNYFRIEGLEQVYGEHYRFIKVILRQIARPVSEALYDLRTGLGLDLAALRARIKTPAIADRFFPVSAGAPLR